VFFKGGRTRQLQPRHRQLPRQLQPRHRQLPRQLRQPLLLLLQLALLALALAHLLPGCGLCQRLGSPGPQVSTARRRHSPSPCAIACNAPSEGKNGPQCAPVERNAHLRARVTLGVGAAVGAIGIQSVVAGVGGIEYATNGENFIWNKWRIVGSAVGAAVGSAVGAAVGFGVGGMEIGDAVGAGVGVLVGC
jgi:hypothetical protein